MYIAGDQGAGLAVVLPGSAPAAKGGRNRQRQSQAVGGSDTGRWKGPIEEQHWVITSALTLVLLHICTSAVCRFHSKHVYKPHDRQ